MMLTVLKVKIQEVTVTESSIDYPGSISLCAALLEASGIREFEQVYVNNKTNGHRIITYAVRNHKKGSVTVNGAASKLFRQGDTVHILAYVQLSEKEAENFTPMLVLTGRDNSVLSSKPYTLR